MRITEKRLRQIISEALREEMISEITRYEKETGKKYRVSEDIEKLVSSPSAGRPISYAFTMTDVPKVGINPKTSYDTPAGVYAYPLNEEYFQKLIDDTLPFQSDAPYCNIMKLDSSQKWLIPAQESQNFASDEDLRKATEAANAVNSTAEHGASLLGRHWKMNNDAKIFDLTYYASKLEPKPTRAWTKLLRKLGYVGVYDPGNSVLHPHEPTQLVCLEPKAYQWIATYETREVRKSSPLVVVPDRKQEKEKKTDNDEILKELERVGTIDSLDDWEIIEYKLSSAGATPDIMQKVWDSLSPRFKKRRGLLDVFVSDYGRSLPKEVKEEILEELLAINAIEDVVLLVTMPDVTQKMYQRVFQYINDKMKSDNSSPNALYALRTLAMKNDLPTADLERTIGMKMDKVLDLLPTDVSAGSPHSSEKKLKKIFKDLLPQVKAGRIYDYDTRSVLTSLTFNKHAPTEVLDGLLKYRVPDEVRINILRNPNIDREQLQKVWQAVIKNGRVLPPDEGSYDDFVYASANPQVSDGELLIALRILPFDLAERIITSKREFTPQLLDSLSQELKSDVLLAHLVENPNISLKTLQRLTHHPKSSIAAKAKKKLAARKG